MRFINTQENNAAMNMAIDEALLLSKEPVLRVYQWKPAAMSLGYNQPTEQINIEECKKQNIDIIRRPTGGKAVLHKDELTYSVIIDTTSKLIPQHHKDNIIESYKIISKGILNALTSLNITAKMKDTKPVKTDTAICFNEPSWYEILHNNKKLVGSAQRRINNKILQHGSILIDVNIPEMCNLFNTDQQKAIKQTQERITTIDNISPKTFKEIADAMKLGFEQNFQLTLREDTLTQEEQQEANKLYKEKYTSKEWNS
jgi:lipoyl(octanoyl) transferase